MRRLLTFGGTLLLAAFVVWASNPARLLELAANLNPRWLPLLAATALGTTAASVWKWSLLLRARPGGLAVPTFLPLLGLYATGQFYNQVLPSNTGGDVVRGELLAGRLRAAGGVAGTGRPEAYASITAERFTGLAVLVLMAVPTALVPAFWGSPMLMVGILAGTLLSVSVMASVLLIRPGAPEASAKPLRPAGLTARTRSRVLKLLAGVRRKLGAFSAGLRAYRHHPRTLGAALALSLLFYVLAVASVMIAARCFGHVIPFLPAAAATAAVLVVSLLPISINGLGLWEASFLATFEALGLGGELGLAVALLIRARDLGWAVIGAAIAAALQGPTGNVAPDQTERSDRRAAATLDAALPETPPDRRSADRAA